MPIYYSFYGWILCRFVRHIAFPIVFPIGIPNKMSSKRGNLYWVSSGFWSKDSSINSWIVLIGFITLPLYNSTLYRPRRRRRFGPIYHLLVKYWQDISDPVNIAICCCWAKSAFSQPIQLLYSFCLLAHTNQQRPMLFQIKDQNQVIIAYKHIVPCGRLRGSGHW